ncbi:NAD(P)-binding protein [Desertivirga brevis]|uniref:NAD(P)-binding protein n=1 Tax=Desertivirga brevis TaxID=2810310 RepID=UPI001A96E2CD|nr:FAD/NAD(P)-binding protein [Pedobacter sp. SYSU D00873]
MSGHRFFRNSVTNSISRRGFMLRAGLICSGIALNACIRKIKPGSSPYSGIPAELKGPDASAGHILRDKVSLPKPSYSRDVGVLVIGGGISGLSAARWLKKNGLENFELLELENQPGGNSKFGESKVSKYPLGAHYVTPANNENKDLIDFYQECNLITHFENGLPFYNEYSLCFDPEERLLINGQWQEGLIPEFGIPAEDKDQIKRFLALMEELRYVRGNDGKYAFDIPLDRSSTDAEWRKLDKLLFSDYLNKNGFNSPYLLWYLEYCCKDDYGQKLDKISAWAGLHYFAGRKGKAVNAESSTVLTWPEGNGFLMQGLTAGLKRHVRSSTLVYGIKEDKSFMLVDVYDLKKKESYQIRTEKLIMATPQYVTRKLLRNFTRTEVDYDDFNYAPWLVANITLKGLTGAPGAPLSWDNVAYNTPSVGYVNANHQDITAEGGSKIITYYLPLCDHDTRVARLAAYARNHEQWLDIVVPELEYLHPNITEQIENVEFWVWGHGMISPARGFVWGESRRNANQPLNDQIFFGHSDLSGVSIFEEAFYQGIKAAKQVLNSNGKV